MVPAATHGLRFRLPQVAVRRFHWIVVAIAVCLGATGCGDSRRARIIGDWEMAVGKDLLEGVVEDQSASPSATDEGPDSESKLLLRFFRSGALETQTNMGSVRTKKQGYWELIDIDEAGGLATLECQLTGQPTQHEVELIDENTIRLVPPNLAAWSGQSTGTPASPDRRPES